MRHCGHIYLSRAEDETLISFFMVTYELLPLSESQEQPAALHLGLSAAQHTQVGASAVIRLYAQAIADAQRWEARHNTRLIVWTITAAPMIYAVCAKYLSELEPRDDGSFTPAGSECALRIAGWLGAKTDSHPFVLKGYATNTRYAPAERNRIAHTSRASRFGLFQTLSIDESTGDRLLMIARIPHEHPTRLLKADSYFPVSADLW